MFWRRTTKATFSEPLTLVQSPINFGTQFGGGWGNAPTERLLSSESGFGPRREESSLPRPWWCTSQMPPPVSPAVSLVAPVFGDDGEFGPSFSIGQTQLIRRFQATNWT